MKESEVEKRIEKNIEKKIWSKTTIMIVLLAVLLVLAIGYIAANEYTKVKSQRELAIYQQGATAGAQQTVAYLFQQGSSCQAIPLFMNNQTMTMIPIECIYNQAKTCKPLPLVVNNQTVDLIATECLQQKQ